LVTSIFPNLKTQQTTYLALGTNQGNKIENLQNAIHKIADEIGNVLKIASIYKTPALGFDGDDFFNTCIQVTTNLSPNDLIQKLLEIEKSLGRERKNKEGYSNRPIDLDIILYADEIIVSKNLVVPHPRMLQRKFVLAPLAEIAGTVNHPIEKTSIQKCLDNCIDDSNISTIKEQLYRPISISEKYNYIAIEGNIGSGKTTLTKMLSDDYNGKTILERYAENPFLPKFYNDQERFAFPLEMSFLADRYQQLSEDLAQFDLFKNIIVSDYYLFKSLIFAQITLQNDEYILYRKMFDLMYKEIVKPDLYIYLHQNTERLLENIKKRGRDYEQNIKASYLEKIHNGYLNYIKTQKDLNILVIDISDLDFVNNEEDYKSIIQQIKSN